MKKTPLLCLALFLSAIATSVVAQNNDEARFTPKVPHLDHAFVIVLENHGYGQIVNNPNMPFINGFAKAGNTATNYFAIAHPSLTNYLEIVGASNFGVLSDNDADWHNA